jgi:glycosyltransferase involved in cell wall biosynthesis
MLVSCVMLTRNRRTFLPKAILDFQSQDYPHKELVIVGDLDSEDILDLIPQDDHRISVHLLSKMTIGYKRNEALEFCKGELIAHQDDDDSYSPERLSDQITRLLESGKKVTGYHTAIGKQVDGEGKWIYEFIPRPGIIPPQVPYVFGASLVYHKSWALSHPFPGNQIGEDNAFQSAANREKQLIASDGREFFTVGIHPGNTSLKRVECAPWRKI